MLWLRGGHGHGGDDGEREAATARDAATKRRGPLTGAQRYQLDLTGMVRGLAWRGVARRAGTPWHAVRFGSV